MSIPCAVEDCPRPAMVKASDWCRSHYRRWLTHGDVKADIPLAPIKPRRRHTGPFESYFEQGAPDECWLWTGPKDDCGYGLFRDPVIGRTTGAHRVAHFRATGELSGRAQHVDHICHTHSCVNPRHLRMVTTKQNQENRAGLNSNNKSGVRGVYQKRGKWVGAVRHNRRKHHTRYYDTVEEAAEATRQLRLTLFTHADEPAA